MSQIKTLLDLMELKNKAKEIFDDEYTKSLDEAINLLKQQDADGCVGCAFEFTNEWKMPCAKCKNACKNYWRMKA